MHKRFFLYKYNTYTLSQQNPKNIYNKSAFKDLKSTFYFTVICISAKYAIFQRALSLISSSLPYDLA